MLKKIFLLLIITNFSFIKESVSKEISNLRTCGIVTATKNLNKGRLSDYWAQEMIGSDLLRKELKDELRKNPLPEDKIVVAVFDSEKLNEVQEGDLDIEKFHNMLVTNLVSGDGPHAILPKLKKGHIRSFDTRRSPQYAAVAKSLKDSPPSFINNSMGWGKDIFIYKAFASLTSYSILVIAAGNASFAFLEPQQKAAAEHLGAIFVGSLSPMGLVSDFSTEGEDVFILAPSDEYLSSADNKGNLVTFGKTSGAAPLTTGSLGAFEILSGYHPTSDEVKILLEKTAFPTLSSQYQKPRQNGVGFLNTYKLGQVGKKIKAKCGEDANCSIDIDEEIGRSDIYQFSVDSMSVLKQAHQSFPECVLTPVISSRQTVSCNEKKKAFNNLRKAAFLETSNKELWKTVSCIYKSSGFTKNSEALDMLVATLSGREAVFQMLKQFAEKTDWELEFSSFEKYEISQLGVIRAAGQLGESEGKAILSFYVDPATSVRLKKEAIRQAGQIGAIDLLFRFAVDPDPEIKKSVAYTVGDVRGWTSLDILSVLSEDSNPEIKKIVAQIVLYVMKQVILTSFDQAFIEEMRTKATTILSRLLTVPVMRLEGEISYGVSDLDWKIYVALAAVSTGGKEAAAIISQLEEAYPVLRLYIALFIRGEIKGKEGVKFLFPYAKSPDPEVRKEVIEIVEYMECSSSSDILFFLKEDPDPDVQISVAQAALTRGETDLALGIMSKLLATDLSSDIQLDMVYIAGQLITGTKENEAMNILSHLAGSSDPQVRLAVAEKAIRMGGPNSKVLLDIVLKDADSFLRVEVARLFLKRGGEAAKAFLSHLRDNDPDPKVRMRVEGFLESISDGA